jgi:hypothetical protein
MKNKQITITMERRTASLLWGSMKIMFEMQLKGKFEMSRETSVILQGAWTDLAHELDGTLNVETEIIEGEDCEFKDL